MGGYNGISIQVFSSVRYGSTQSCPTKSLINFPLNIIHYNPLTSARHRAVDSIKASPVFRLILLFARKDFRGPSNLTQDQSDPRSPHGNLGARGSCQTQQTGETLEYSPWPHQHPWEIYQSNPLPFVKIVRGTTFSKYFCVQGKCCFPVL